MKNPQSHPQAENFQPPRRRRVGRMALLAGLLVALLGTGCQTVHEVTVDAISNPRMKNLGESYQLEVIDPSGGVDAELTAMAVAAIKDTLGARGLYEAPPGGKPDTIITYTFGVGHGHINIVTQQNTDLLLGPMISTQSTSSKAVVVYDKFVELSAREAIITPDPDRPGAPPRKGEELWNIRATIVDSKATLVPYLPSLASACIDYVGRNTGKELHFKVESNEAKAILKQRSLPLPPASASAAAAAAAAATAK